MGYTFIPHTPCVSKNYAPHIWATLQLKHLCTMTFNTECWPSFLPLYPSLCFLCMSAVSLSYFEDRSGVKPLLRPRSLFLPKLVPHGSVVSAQQSMYLLELFLILQNEVWFSALDEVSFSCIRTRSMRTQLLCFPSSVLKRLRNPASQPHCQSLFSWLPVSTDPVPFSFCVQRSFLFLLLTKLPEF